MTALKLMAISVQLVSSKQFEIFKIMTFFGRPQKKN